MQCDSRELPDLFSRGADERRIVTRRRLLFEQDALTKIPSVLRHENQVQQVFLSILANALDALKESGIDDPAVQITIAFEGGMVGVTISDNGHGIDPGSLQKVFDPFFTTKPTGQGTGLGLSVSRSIITAHGGEITCDSKVGLGLAICRSIAQQHDRRIWTESILGEGSTFS